MGNILPILISYKMYKEHFKENIQYKRENIKHNINKNNLKEKNFHRKLKIKKNI
tara:strand:+ start:557 stop:718 length:162 start_codon:yes stop_codon:yes gene_type:complete